MDRLMGDHGFPALLKSAKRFKPRGKGNEVGRVNTLVYRLHPERFDTRRGKDGIRINTDIKHKDLRDLLTVYQLWAHGMFPKGDFEGTIKRVETICRTRRMEVSFICPSFLVSQSVRHRESTFAFFASAPVRKIREIIWLVKLKT